jgi:electron transport complex protein RnfG
MAVQSNLKNMALVLTLTCLFCSAILGGAYALTKDPIDKAAEAKTAKAIGAVLPEFDATSYETVSVDGKDFNYYLAKKGSETVGYAVESSTSGFGGPLSLIVGITADGVVYNTSVLSHSETPGLGAKCTTDEKFTSQWKGLNPSEKILKVKQDNGDIDAITASTITSRAYTLAVQNALSVVSVITGANPDATTGATTSKEETSNE